MAHKLWTSPDELTGDTSARDRQEFNDDVAAALEVLRREHGIDENGNWTGQAPETPATADDAQVLQSLLPDASRRGFLKLTGAATVFSLAGCWNKPPETLVPHVVQPEGSTIGEPVYFSTTIRVEGEPIGVMAKTFDFRPIKLEGNPDHPQSLGRLHARGQAAVLDLYDADRAQHGPESKATGDWATASWAELDKQVGEAVKAGKVALLTGPVDGPATAELIKEFGKACGDGFRHVAYHPFAQDVARQARGLSFGEDQAVDPVYHFDKAQVIVALGSCLLSGGATGLDAQVGFGKFRQLKNAGHEKASVGQLISFEPTLSQTGSVADLRHRVDMEDLEAVAWAIAVQVKKSLGADAPELPAGAAERAGEAPQLHHNALVKQEGRNGVPEDPILHAAQRLIEHRGKGIVYVGGANHTGKQSLGLFLAANYLNAALGNEGPCIETATAPESAATTSCADAVALLEDCVAGEVDTLIVVGANPAYDLAGNIDVAKAFEKVKQVVALADRRDETADLASVFMPTTHDLESWGDAETRKGVYSLQQPVIRPLWDSRQWQESLLSFAVHAGSAPDSFKQEAGEVTPVKAVIGRAQLWQGKAAGVCSWHAYLQAIWQEEIREAVGSIANAASFWQAALATGVAESRAAIAGKAVSFGLKDLGEAKPAGKRSGYSLVLNASRSLGDGSQANNAWLQECPDPLSKVSWDNYLAVSITDAKDLNLQKFQMVKVSIGDKVLDKVPTMIQPGQKAGTVELFLGWGRERAGTVARDWEEFAPEDGLGQRLNAFELSGGERWGIPVQVTALDEFYELALTQHHAYMDGRNIAYADPLDLHKVDPSGRERAHHHFLWKKGTGTVNESVMGPANPMHDVNSDGTAEHPGGGRISLWDSTHVYPGRRWGMAIDLNACTGCNACLVACSAENNVPVVGRDQMRAGRELHWLRIDRYYSSPEKDQTYYDKEAGTDEWNRQDQHHIENDDPEHLEVIHQLMMCQQCAHAPCEEVCPAMATMHNEEGINLQVYNRCIGTRFCANNCPYKVRRFNFYEYSKYRIGPRGSRDPFDRVVRNLTQEGSISSDKELGPWQAPLAMVLNPEVSVRSKGVMEKCNFCVQRTRTIRESEKRSGTAYDDTAPGMTSACAQTCPTQAITFGDINDPFSSVNEELKASPHRFKVLDFEANTRPAIQYLRIVRNRPADSDEAAVIKKVKDKHTKPAEGKPEKPPHSSLLPDGFVDGGQV